MSTYPNVSVISVPGAGTEPVVRRELRRHVEAGPDHGARRCHRRVDEQLTDHPAVGQRLGRGAPPQVDVDGRADEIVAVHLTPQVCGLTTGEAGGHLEELRLWDTVFLTEEQFQMEDCRHVIAERYENGRGELFQSFQQWLFVDLDIAETFTAVSEFDTGAPIGRSAPGTEFGPRCDSAARSGSFA
ncbi:hypothetical protein [Nocardia sp. BMG111209]|uniref:hypothetical protein n=1 Tax=Nocardia sp. BMG111209 TaxID=1160137 RepID=UPI0012DE3B59|nr:hypothetical protein [Nocardia sp. BMG111209]